MFFIVDKVTGQKISETADITLVADPLDPAYEVIQLTDNLDGTWNPATKTFLPKDPTYPYITTREFLNRLEKDEKKGIIFLAKTNTDAELFLTELKILGNVQVGPYLQNALDYLESVGILAEGRAAEIFNV